MVRLLEAVLGSLMRIHPFREGTTDPPAPLANPCHMQLLNAFHVLFLNCGYLLLSWPNAVTCVPHAVLLHLRAVRLLYHSACVPAVGHSEVQGSEGGAGTPCQQAPAVRHKEVCICPYLMKPHVLMHCCMDLLPFRFCSKSLRTQIMRTNDYTRASQCIILRMDTSKSMHCIGLLLQFRA